MITWSFYWGWLVHGHSWGHWGFFPYSLFFTSRKTSGFVHMLRAEFQEENLLPFLKSATMIMAESSLLVMERVADKIDLVWTGNGNWRCVGRKYRLLFEKLSCAGNLREKTRVIGVLNSHSLSKCVVFSFPFCHSRTVLWSTDWKDL